MPKRSADNALSTEVAAAALLAWLDLARVGVRKSISAGSPVSSTERRPNGEIGGSEDELLEGIVHSFPELDREVNPTTSGVGFPVYVHPCRLTQ